MKLHALIYLPRPRAEWQPASSQLRNDEVSSCFHFRLFFSHSWMRFVLMSCSRQGKIVSPQNAVDPINTWNCASDGGGWRRMVQTRYTYTVHPVINQLIIVAAISFCSSFFFICKNRIPAHWLSDYWRSGSSFVVESGLWTWALVNAEIADAGTYECWLATTQERCVCVYVWVYEHESSFKLWLFVFNKD